MHDDPSADRGSLTILVVENHQDTCRHLCRYLRQKGHEVTPAYCVHEALEALSSFSYDVLLSDIGLPDGDGWSLMSAGHVPTPSYAIAMSGFGTEQDVARSLSVGFRHHLTKPFQVETLNHLLDEYLQCQGN